jgi:hypothetical protein
MVVVDLYQNPGFSAVYNRNSNRFYYLILLLED